MTIVNKIKNLFEESTGLTLLYNNEEMVNLLIDDNPLPIGIWYLLQDGQIVADSASGVLRERVQARIYVGDKCENLDFNGIENEAIIEQCKNVLFRFINSLRLSGEVRLESINTSRRFYLETDTIITGYMVDVTISEVNGFFECKSKFY